jgi:hypothetical protein
MHSTVPFNDFGAVVFGGLNAPNPCTLDVRVNAPDPSRSKSLRVWSGQCINVENAPR